MQHCYERLVEILGQPCDSPLFANFLAECGDVPEILAMSMRGDTRMFKKMGISLVYFEHSKCFAMVSFHFETQLVLSGYMQKFSGPLFCGITQTDTRDEIETKLRCKPNSSLWVQGKTPSAPRDLWEVYEFANIEYTFIFVADTSQLSMMSLRWKAAF